MLCKLCGVINDYCEKPSSINHEASPNHQRNLIFSNYNNNKSYFNQNRDGLHVICNAYSEEYADATTTTIDQSDKSILRLYVKRNQTAKYFFNMKNDSQNDYVLIVGVSLARPHPQFQVTYNPYIFGEQPRYFHMNSSISRDVCITFCSPNTGEYAMPIMFTFHKPSENKNIIIIREMLVNVEDHARNSAIVTSSYKNSMSADYLVKSVGGIRQMKELYKIPKWLKAVFPLGLKEENLEKLDEASEVKDQLRIVMKSTRNILEEGPTKENYMMFFHHLLWWEETKQKINMRNYNMKKKTISKHDDDKVYKLAVPGLAEKRPSLLRGDRVLIIPRTDMSLIFESQVLHLEECYACLSKIDRSFREYYSPNALFDIRFLMNRVPMEIMHKSISRLFLSGMEHLIFPTPNLKKIVSAPIERFYNNLIEGNLEQRCAVEHIVSETSGKVPYIVFGPPGTGKTMTIVEAILQLVMKSPQNKILACAETNKAADHLAVLLLKYAEQLNIGNFLFRANSRAREWSSFPRELDAVSNGTCIEDWYSVKNKDLSIFRIVVTTLCHSAKYGSAKSQSVFRLKMSHLFIDEAAQAAEPSALTPITGLLASNGHLILAGDPKQLGPLCISKEAGDRGLGNSLMDRLLTSYSELYKDNAEYMTMLVKNYRSDPDILTVPNELFYENRLKPCAAPDDLSKLSVLGLEGGNRAIVFHAVHSEEQKVEHSPGYFNEKELEMVRKYLKALVKDHGVQQTDIGVISPYLRQVYRMKNWAASNNYADVEIGTVEAFQGAEKRVILVSTVRANSNNLAYDAKFKLGFLVDDRRFNVAITRAKSKIIIIGNPSCLAMDIKWRKFMELCKQFGSYHDIQMNQLERSLNSLTITKAKKNKSKKKPKKKVSAGV